MILLLQGHHVSKCLLLVLQGRHVIREALKCIMAQKDNVTDAYSNAIIAYALTLAKHPGRAEFLGRLKSQATIKGLVHDQAILSYLVPRMCMQVSIRNI